ncbi:MAG: UbiH/UbiF family hydroxylase [Betaproteobacteria bacterium]|nr:UbiH/UbiF family hydroxylase [Betaproteobacteria bacterium]MDH3436914.1 UbiH/UbiF family hydroxylase [Betaproteobacteria bacterium]
MQTDLDVLIVGGGLVGLSLAAALRDSGLRLALVEPHVPRRLPAARAWDSRIYAISPGSAGFLERCGAWQGMPEDRIARVETMRIYGDDGRAELEFSAYDAGLRELAFIVENGRLQTALWRVVRDGARICCPATWSTLELDAHAAALRLDDGAELSARLVVGADGAESRIRAAAGIDATPNDYGQLGVVANFSCEKAHRGVAFQWFRRDGVLALLPLPGNRVSMVWSIAQERGRELLAKPADELAAEVEAASRGAVGALALITRAAAFPLRLLRVTDFTRARLALVGDAAHNVHPLAGQGVNLGFRDARELSAVLSGRGPQQDCGDHALLRRYERARREDVLSMQLMTHTLQKLFNNDAVWLGKVRNLGLKLANGQPQLKSLLVHHAVA